MYVLADDVGWNDFGYQSTDLGGDSLPYGGATPTLDRLARAGVRLSNFYAMPDCTPSRAALLTGVHPIHTGLYHMSIATTMPFGLPLRFATLPQYLKEVQPETKSHGVGKWDLGHFEAHYVPTARGFDSWYGYYSSFTSYFPHVGDLGECQGPTCFHDFNLNGKAPAAPRARTRPSSSRAAPRR